MEPVEVRKTRLHGCYMLNVEPMVACEFFFSEIKA
jgi:hypothetical protein